MIVVLPAKQIRCIQQPYVIVDLGFCPSPVPYCDVYVPLNSITNSHHIIVIVDYSIKAQRKTIYSIFLSSSSPEKSLSLSFFRLSS